MVNESKAKTGVNIEQTIKTPADLAELKEQLNTLSAEGDRFILAKQNDRPKGFFAKVKTAIGVNK